MVRNNYDQEKLDLSSENRPGVVEDQVTHNKYVIKRSNVIHSEKLYKKMNPRVDLSNVKSLPVDSGLPELESHSTRKYPGGNKVI